ncbi:MAG: pyridoxamine 5'-phosphate oxidase [Sphingosinicella sp.]|nr:pyridoxamine 5'-phosphate oxidase [Sphingosinicella sp.]
MTNDPHSLFDLWFEEARQSEPNDPEAMALATCDTEGRPSVRMVLLKNHDARGFTFHTNLESRKGGEIEANPNAAIVFHWKSLRRQVRVEGRIEPVSVADADAYFATRSRGSQLSAWASSQSRPLESAEALAARYADMVERFEGQDVPRPAHWTGLRLVPRVIEFWSNGDFRLHQRRLFTLTGNDWHENLLYP